MLVSHREGHDSNPRGLDKTIFVKRLSSRPAAGLLLLSQNFSSPPLAAKGVNGLGNIDGAVENMGLKEEPVRPQAQGFAFEIGIFITGENDDGDLVQFRSGTNILEHVEAAAAGHDDIQEDQIGPMDVDSFALFDEGPEVGDCLFC